MTRKLAECTARRFFRFSLRWLLLAVALVAVLLALVIPTVESRRHSAKCDLCKGNLHQVGSAAVGYFTAHGRFPPAYTFDSNGKRMHSWRVQILPYLGPEAVALYNRYNFNEPWDSPSNQRLADKMPSVFCCPFQPSTSVPSYFAVTRDGELGYLAGVDGARKLQLLIEVLNRNVNWLSPYGDVKPDEVAAIRSKTKIEGHQNGIIEAPILPTP
ncbi:MAG: DUF1559 domain-containing protein [Planctomycetota bacterium]|nr:DUF1559 domain-containing protein [Planctomycetota bacterium]